MPKNKLPEIVETMFDAVRESLDAPLADKDIQSLLTVIKVCDAIHDPERTYIPHGNAIRTALNNNIRNDSIRADFNGKNYEQLGRRYGLTGRHLRRILGKSSANE